MMNKVFIIEPPRQNIDVSKAETYGEIVYIFSPTSRRCSVFSHACFGQTVLQRLKELDFDFKADSICIVGAMVTVLTAIIAISQRYDEFNVLLFNSVDDSYVQKRFDKNDWKGCFNGTKSTTTVKSN